MNRLPDQWTPSPAAVKVIQAAQLQAEKLLLIAAEHLQCNKVPEDGVLYQLRIPADPGNPHAALNLQIAWPGVLQLVKANVGLLQSANLANANLVMRDRLTQLRARCPADRVLLKATIRRPHGLPLKATFDASGVLRVMHSRTHKLLAVSAPGAPFKLAPGFQALSFHDLMPRIR